MLLHIKSPKRNQEQPKDSSKYVDVDILLSKAKEKMKIEDNGCGEYLMSQVFHIRESPPSPQSYGSSYLLQAQHSDISTQNPTSINENTSICIEKEKEEQEPTLISPSKYGPRFTIMHKQGYDGYSGLGY